MSQHRKSILRQILNVAFATLLSRILGLIRVMFESMVLGGGTIASAWHLAITIPNLFRRLLGEGALGTALIPVLVHTEEKEGTEQVRRDLAVVFAALGIVLALIVIAVAGGSLIAAKFIRMEYWRIALQLQPILMPYALFICFSGVIGAVLNSRKEFFLPALGALLLNIFLIAGLAAGFMMDVMDDFSEWLRYLDVLAYLVLASGIIQVGLLLLLLKVRGVFPAFTREAFRNLAVLKELGHLVLPGMIGGAALQLSFLADRTMASWLGAQAVPALVYTDRLVDLPIGLFAVGMSSVLMANMARSAAQGDLRGMTADLEYGLRMVWFACIPMAFFLVLFREPMLRLLLFRGNFTESDLQETSLAAFYMGMGLPFFCSLKVILPAFYARKQMFKPFKVSICCILLNLLLNYILMWHLRQGGIALATVISSWANNSLLLLLLYREGIRVPFAVLLGGMGRAVSAAALAGGSMFLLLGTLNSRFGIGTGGLIVTLMISACGFGVIYLLLHRFSGGREVLDFIRLLKRRGGKKVE